MRLCTEQEMHAPEVDLHIVQSSSQRDLGIVGMPSACSRAGTLLNLISGVNMAHIACTQLLSDVRLSASRGRVGRPFSTWDSRQHVRSR